jgi:hypothetical protein
MPEATSAGGGYTCQVCAATYATKELLFEHGREQHPGKPVTWGDPIESTVTNERDDANNTGRAGQIGSEVKSDVKGIGDKVKAGAKAVGSKITDPDRDLETEYQKKKEEE